MGTLLKVVVLIVVCVVVAAILVVAFVLLVPFGIKVPKISAWVSKIKMSLRNKKVVD